MCGSWEPLWEAARRPACWKRSHKLLLLSKACTRSPLPPHQVHASKDIKVCGLLGPASALDKKSPLVSDSVRGGFMGRGSAVQDTWCHEVVVITAAAR